MTFTEVTVFAIDHVARHVSPDVLDKMVDLTVGESRATLSVRVWPTYGDHRRGRVYRVKLLDPWMGPVFLVATDMAA